MTGAKITAINKDNVTFYKNSQKTTTIGVETGAMDATEFNSDIQHVGQVVAHPLGVGVDRQKTKFCLQSKTRGSIVNFDHITCITGINWMGKMPIAPIGVRGISIFTLLRAPGQFLTIFR